MAEQIRYNQLYDALSPVDQQAYAGYKIARNLVPSERETQDEAFPDYKEILDAEAAAQATKPNMWNPMNWIFSPAESAMATPEERAAVERSSADIERRIDPEGSYPMPVGRDQGPLQYRDPQQYYMENRPSEYDLWSGPETGPIGSTGRMGTNEYFPTIDYKERYPNPYSFEGRRGLTSMGTEYDEGLQRALINQKQANLYDNRGIGAVDIQETMGPEEQIMTRPNFGRIDPLTTNQKPGLFEGIGQKLGMTQVSPEDRAANEQFMQDQGIRRDPQTGRMIGGDFEGMNPAGKSGWGSATFGEMAQNWMDDYGDVEYSVGVIGDMKRKKQARMKKRAAEYQAKIQQQAIQEKTRQDALRGAGAYSSQVQMDPGGGGTWHGQTAAKEAAGQQVAGPGFGKGAYFYRGGRVGYNTGGRVGILSIF